MQALILFITKHNSLLFLHHLHLLVSSIIPMILSTIHLISQFHLCAMLNFQQLILIICQVDRFSKNYLCLLIIPPSSDSWSTNLNYLTLVSYFLSLDTSPFNTSRAILLSSFCLSKLITFLFLIFCSLAIVKQFFIRTVLNQFSMFKRQHHASITWY